MLTNESVADRVSRLRLAASAGDAAAARELGRLLCLVPVHPDDPPAEEPDDDWRPTWPAQRWLQAAVDESGDDMQARQLLAGLLLNQISSALDAASLVIDEDEETQIEESNEERAEKVRALYSEVLYADPHDRVATAGLAVLRELMDEDGSELTSSPEESGYAYYEVCLDMSSGSVSYEQSVLATDPDELRWACDIWLSAFHPAAEESAAGLALFVHAQGDVIATIPLGEHFRGTIDWSAVAIPPLPAEPLPPGYPLNLTAFYGYNDRFLG